MGMLGAYEAKNFVNDYLKQSLPTRLLEYRNEWNLDDENLPDPVKYFVYEPVALDKWPTLITVLISMNGLERDGYTGNMDPVYRVDYTMRTYIWCKDDDSEQVTAKRDRLMTVLRTAFLDSPSLNKCADGFDVVIDEGTLREEYSDLTLIKGERVMAGGYVAYTMTIEETVTRDVIYDSSVSGASFTPEAHLLLPLLKDL